MKNQTRISPAAYKSEGFIGKYQKLIKDTVIPYQYTVLCDEAPDTEKSHVVQNFINAGKAVRSEDVGDGFYGMVFQELAPNRSLRIKYDVELVLNHLPLEAKHDPK